MKRARFVMAFSCMGLVGLCVISACPRDAAASRPAWTRATHGALTGETAFFFAVGTSSRPPASRQTHAVREAFVGLADLVETHLTAHGAELAANDSRRKTPRGIEEIREESLVLRGVRLVDSWLSGKKRLYVLAVIDVKDLRRSFDELDHLADPVRHELKTKLDEYHAAVRAETEVSVSAVPVPEDPQGSSSGDQPAWLRMLNGRVERPGGRVVFGVAASPSAAVGCLPRAMQRIAQVVCAELVATESTTRVGGKVVRTSCGATVGACQTIGGARTESVVPVGGRDLCLAVLDEAKIAPPGSPDPVSEQVGRFIRKRVREMERSEKSGAAPE